VRGDQLEETAEAGLNSVGLLALADEIDLRSSRRHEATPDGEPADRSTAPAEPPAAQPTEVPTRSLDLPNGADLTQLLLPPTPLTAAPATPPPPGPRPATWRFLGSLRTPFIVAVVVLLSAATIAVVGDWLASELRDPEPWPALETGPDGAEVATDPDQPSATADGGIASTTVSSAPATSAAPPPRAQCEPAETLAAAEPYSGGAQITVLSQRCQGDYAVGRLLAAPPESDGTAQAPFWMAFRTEGPDWVLINRGWEINEGWVLECVYTEQLDSAFPIQLCG
jgi:hypothetical protein